MLPAFFSPRPKSISNIIGDNQIESKAVQDLQEDHRFRTYNVKDLKMAKAYLPPEVIREFKEGFEASAKSPSTSKSRNFVRKLVANLENKKDHRSGHCTADAEFLTKCYIRTPAKSSLVFKDTDEKADFFDDHYATNIKNLSQSIGDDEEKKKQIDAFDEEAENELKADEFMKICSIRNFHDSNQNDIFQEKVDYYGPIKDLPRKKEETYCDARKYDFNQNLNQSNDDTDFYFRPEKPINPPDIIYLEPKNKKNSLRRPGPLEEKRSFKSVLTSLMGFRRRKSVLPKGKRNILSPKDSLGEEMRLFRRDMMPVLLRAAGPYNNDSEEKSKDETFSSIIAAARPKTRSSGRIASIHPFYRGKKSGPTFLHTLEEENLEPQSESSENYSQPQDIQKSVLPEKSPSLYQRPPPVIYDVPKSNKIIRPGLELKKDRENLINYENVGIMSESDWNRKSNFIPRKNIVCGQRALYIRNQRQELETRL